MNTQAPRKIAIIDDHPMIRSGLAGRISIESDLRVCGEADNVPDALQLIERTQPDLAVVDISLAEGNGIDLVKRVHSKGDPVQFLVWSVYPEDLYADRAFRAGAHGYITKDAATDTIIDAIRQVLDGHIYASPKLTRHLLVRNLRGQSGNADSPLDELSDRELEVFTLIGEGRSTQEIAGDLKLSPNTVETYRSRIRQKLDLDSSAQLTRSAMQWVLENN